MRDANLVRVMARQCRGKIGLADLFTVSGGPETLRSRLTELAESGHVAAIADAVFERDLGNYRRGGGPGETFHRRIGTWVRAGTRFS